MAITISDFKFAIDPSAENARELAAVSNGEVSDGYHTFNELYEHRHNMFIGFGTLLSMTRPDVTVWKSKVHSDGSDVWDGWFIAGINWNGFQLTYHLPIGKWELCERFDTLDIAPTWDGHTAKDVESRLLELANYLTGNRLKAMNLEMINYPLLSQFADKAYQMEVMVSRMAPADREALLAETAKASQSPCSWAVGAVAPIVAKLCTETPLVEQLIVASAAQGNE